MLPKRPAAPDFQPTMILLDRLDVGEGRVLPVLGLANFKECRDRFGQFWLVVLHRQNVVGLLVPNRLGNVGVREQPTFATR